MKLMVHTVVGASFRMETAAASASSGRICLPDSNTEAHNLRLEPKSIILIGISSLTGFEES